MTARVHKNLNNGLWSVRRGSKGKVAHAAAVALAHARFHVSETGRARVVARHCREVHAWAAGEEIPAQAAPPADAVEVTYNPYRAATFTTRDGRPVARARTLWFCADGRLYAEEPE